MRLAVITCAALVPLMLPVHHLQAEEIAPYRLTDFWAFLELRYRNDQINNQSIGFETAIDDARWQTELGVSTTSYIFHPKLLRMRIAGSLLSDRQNIAREQISLPPLGAYSSSSSRDDLLLNLDATFQFLKDKPYPTTISYYQDNPIVNTGVEGSFTQEIERVGFDFQLRDVLPFGLTINGLRDSSFGESLDRVVDYGSERFSVKAKRTFSPGNRMGLDFEIFNQESRNGDPRRPIQETVRRAQRAVFTSNSRLGDSDQLRIDQSTSFNRRDEPDVTDFSFAPRIRWLHSSNWESRYQYRLTRSERPQSNFEYAAEAMSASVHYTPSENFTTFIRSDFDRSEEVNRLSQSARGFSGRANMKHNAKLGQLNMAAALGYRLDDRESQSPRIVIEEEAIILAGTAPVPLSRSFVVSGTIVVRNDTRTQVYIEGVDYLVSEVGSLTRIERLISGSILDGETVLVDYEAQTGGTFAFDQTDQFLSADFRFARYHNIFLRYVNSRQSLRSGLPTLPLNSVEAIEVGVRERIPLRWGGIQLFGEARYRHQDEDINPFNQSSLMLSIQAPLSSALNLNTSVARNIVENWQSDEDSDVIAFNANVTWQAMRNLTIRAEGNHDEDTGGTVLRRNTRWKMTAQWRYRKVTFGLDGRYTRMRQGVLDNDHYELWLRIRRDLF